MSTLSRPKHIGRNISRIRELRDMKQEALAQALGTNQQAVSAIENSESIDEEKLITENINGKWNVQQFREVEYAIPASVLKGKKTIRVKFQALPEHTAGAVYDVRLVKK